MRKTTTLLEVLAWLFAGCLPQAFTSSCYLQRDPYLPCNPEVMLWQGEQQWMTKGTKSPQIEKRRQHGVIPLARVADGGEPFKMAPLSRPALCSAHPQPPSPPPPAPVCLSPHTDRLPGWLSYCSYTCSQRKPPAAPSDQPSRSCHSQSLNIWNPAGTKGE